MYCSPVRAMTSCVNSRCRSSMKGLPGGAAMNQFSTTGRWGTLVYCCR